MRSAMMTVAFLILGNAISAQAQDARPAGEKVDPLFAREIDNLPGKSLKVVEVIYPPGAASSPHTHPGSVFVYAYVLSGEVESGVNGDRPRRYRAGQSWLEPAGARHIVSRNASKSRTARLLAVFLVNSATPDLVRPIGK